MTSVNTALIISIFLAFISIDRIHIYPRDVVRRALMLDASVTLVAHNHPNGDPTPSAADKRLTQN